jgi:hypothetical protein
VHQIRAKSPDVDVKRVLEILSSLYPNKAFALVRENLQNSIDAGAKNVWITFNPEDRRASFLDDGSGVPLARMNESQYFALMWSTKRGKFFIGSYGIGRLTNIAAAKSVTVETHDGREGGVFTWHSNGSFSKRKNATRTLTSHGFSLTLSGVHTLVAQDLPKKVEIVASDVFDDYIRKGLAVSYNGDPIKAKEYLGKRHAAKLKAGGDIELYWTREGQPPQDQGVVLKCRGVRVGETTRFGIDSEQWRNVAGVLHLDDRSLTATRDTFEDTLEFRHARDEAITKVRSFLSRYEGGRKGRLDKMAQQYTKAALEAAKRLGIDLALLGPSAPGRGTEGPVGSNPGERIGKPVPDHEEASREPPETHRRREGEEPGFRLIPRDFKVDVELASHAAEMTWRTGPVIFVNLGHPACPGNKHARSLYIWCCGFAEIVRWGGLSATDALPRERLLLSYKGWLQCWKPELVRYTAGVD